MSAPYVRDDDPEQIYEDAPCGYVSTRPDGVIVRANRTFLALTGFHADELTDKRRFSTLLTKPGALLYETHCAPLLRLRGSVSEIALDIVGRDGEPLPVLLNARVKCDRPVRAARASGGRPRRHTDTVGKYMKQT